MSDEGQPTESMKDALLGLNSLDLGPAWARGGGDDKKGGGPAAKEVRRHDDRGDERRGAPRRDDRRDDRRDGRGREGRRFDNREKDEGGRREGRGGGGRRPERGGGGRGRREEDRGSALRDETPPPEGFTATVMPVEDGLDGLAREIMAGGRTYSVFDLAKLVLGARDRFNVNFRCEDDARMFRCKKDGSLWLTKEEALRQFWHSGWRKDFYEEVVSESSPPAGNFQTIARCGISGEWLGPPNYHGYQPAIARLHRERFSNMPLEAYKRKIRMERSEEAVNTWLAKMSKRVRYRPTGGVKPDAGEAVEAGKGPESKAAPTREERSEELVAEEGTTVEVSEAAVGAAPVTETPAPVEVSVADPGEDDANQPGEGDEAGAGPAAGDEGTEDDGEDEVEETLVAAKAPGAGSSQQPLIDDVRGVERHFLEHHFEDAFQVTNRAWVAGNISGHHLSPGLLTLLRQAVAEERRYPGKLTPMLCRQLSGRHVAVFKWGRKLKAGPSRPHPIPSDIVLADRPQALLTWIAANSGKKLPHLWKSLLPEKVSDPEKLGWYHDLHWLLNQGYALLMADSSVHLARKPGEGDPSEGAAPRAKRAKKGRERGAPPGPKAAAEPSAPAPAARPAPAAEPALAALPLARPSGLYAIGGRTLSGMPKVPESLNGRGLWPRLGRVEVEEEDEADAGEERW